MSKFEQDKESRIKSIEAQIEMVKNGAMLKSLELELMIAKRQTPDQGKQDRRFIVNQSNPS